MADIWQESGRKFSKPGCTCYANRIASRIRDKSFDNFPLNRQYSLDIIKISHRLKTELAVDITVVTLFRYPTVRTTAAYLNQEVENFSQKKQEIFHALDKGKHKLKKRIEKRNKKWLK